MSLILRMLILSLAMAGFSFLAAAGTRSLLDKRR